MSAHRALNDFFRAFDSIGPGRLTDPGAAGTITVGMWGQICSVVTATAEARTLAAPTKPGILCAVVLDEDGGDLTLTVNPASGTMYGYNRDLDTSITFADAGDYVVFYSIKVGTEHVWRAVAQEGTNVTVEEGAFDNIAAASVLATNVSIATGLTAPNILANTTISARSILATSAAISNLTANNLTATTTAISVPSITATNVTIGTGLTVPSIVAATAMSLKSGLLTHLSVATQATIPNILCSSNLTAASVLATNLSVGTQATIPNISCTSNASIASILASYVSVATGMTVPLILATSAMSLKSGLLTNLSVATGLSAKSILATDVSVGAATVTAQRVLGGATIQVSGGTAAVDTQATALLSPTLAMISVGTASKNYFKLPNAAIGLCVNVINAGASTIGLLGDTAGVSFASATSTALATANASGSALNLVCDGTNWWHREV